MISLLEKIPSLEQFQEALRNHPTLFMQHLWDAPKAVLLMLAQKTLKKNVLVLTGGARENRLIDDLLYFDSAKIFEFPSWETLPGDEIKPSTDLVGKRLEILYQLQNLKEPHIVLCPLQAALQKLPVPKTLNPLCAFWKVGDEIPFEYLSAFLTARGYKKNKIAADKGEFALRGGILDIFPVASPDPYRIEFFDDTIEQIRTYDPIGQKSVGKASQVFICPADEYDLLVKSESLCSLIDYFQDEPIIVFDDITALEDRYLQLQTHPSLKSRLFLPFDELKAVHQLYFSKENLEDLNEEHKIKPMGRDFYSKKSSISKASFELLNKSIDTHAFYHSFEEITDYFASPDGKNAENQAEIFHGIHEKKEQFRLHFITETESDENHLKQSLKLQEVTLPQHTYFERGYLSSGFACEGIVLLPTPELTKKHRVRREKWRSTYHTPASEFHELFPGDLVVHFHNGIGKYLGIEKKANHLGTQTEFFVIEYADNSKLYTPVSQSHLVSRYIGAREEVPTLSTLGTSKWQKTKLNAQNAILGYAKDLLEFNAKRSLKGGYACGPDSEVFKTFENDFPFIETEDQIKAINDVKNDMTSEKAMDRLICGDVGYGKTEVAMRAAMKAVLDGGKQVAVLVPTTVLAIQHFEAFQERMVNFPIKVAALSRKLKAKEVKELLQKTADGEIDILIGTHRLLSPDVHFKDLGLIIIDEEQRFGVKAKEHLKTMKIGVDTLTLSATPIPRTLYLSLVGTKDVSVIATPPQDRLPIKTMIVPREEEIIKNAILRELSRDGQVFMIHNRVESIFHVASELQKLVPHARIGVAHGQMDIDDIDDVFHQFKSGESDLLVATTIIENGVDIPNANTILIDRAHHFGMADLYQMRGRVGRWNRPAFAYFLVPKNQSLAEVTTKRLHALAETSGYGGGMKIAMRDLEIRGAGDILGVKQSGQISSIGFHLYCKLLKRTVETMQKKIPVTFYETKMEFSYDAKLGESYINETSLRLEIYYRLGEATTLADVDLILEELKDRFGTPPQSVIWLYHLTRIRVFASSMGVLLLKFLDKLLFIEMQLGKKEISTKVPLIPTKTPKELEDYVIDILPRIKAHYAHSHEKST